MHLPVPRLMSDKAEKHPLSKRSSKKTDAPAEAPTPIIPIRNSGLAEALKHGGRIYELMVDSVRDYAIFMLDPDGHVASWSKGAQRIKGYTADEIIGRHFSAFYPPEDIAAGKPPRELKQATRQGKFEEEGIRLRKDGSAFWASVVITAVRDVDGSLVGFAKVTRDLTERRAAQERAIADARRLAKAEAANTAKGEFLAAMSHELRTPLNAIGGYTELLSLGLGGPVNSEQLDYLERIRKSQQHLLGIISDLLNFTRIEAGHVNYDLVPIQLQKVIDSVMPMIQPAAAAKAITLRIEPSSGDCIAVGDAARVDQILLNLLSNAIKYTAPTGSITVKCAVSADAASISVTDTGRGVPKEKLEAIFEPFVQLGRSLSSAHEGMGLGLSISRDLARAMNGDLIVVSKVGEGSTFSLILPRSF
ncbi:MAG: PAS domain-containing sensor histidine kinase [Gemmatimonadota bacterium]|nr:PAS domain-containing sensor histidine kinase [Gemmatimonadota bacterium]